MIRYHYNTQVQPPAPFIAVSIRNPVDGRELHAVPAQIDSGADLTVVPEQVVQTLGLSEIGQTRVAGLGGATFSVRAYVVFLGVHNLPARAVRVISGPDEQWVLLGRDVLNAHRFALDGPQLVVEVG